MFVQLDKKRKQKKTVSDVKGQTPNLLSMVMINNKNSCIQKTKNKQK